MSSPVPKKRKRTVSRNENYVPVGQNEKYLTFYHKGRVTCGYYGFEYEIKLAGLIHYNLTHNDNVKTFLLATNLTAAWPFDDICFKIEWKDIERHTIVFIQAKHKINKRKPEINLDDIFKGYKNIQNKLNDKGDELFNSKLDEYECYLILYTNGDFGFKTVPVTDNYCPELNDIIETNAGGTVKRLSEEEKKKLSKELSENDNFMWENFLKSLLLFSGQANEKGVEEILKGHIADYQSSLGKSFQVTTEAATALYISAFVDWWKTLVDLAPCLTEKNDFLKLSFNRIIKDPLMSSHNIIYKRKIKHNYTFIDDAVSSLNLQCHSSTVIIAENIILTVIKVMQYLKTRNHVVIDLEYIANLQYREREALCKELKTTKDNVIILVCDKIPEKESFKDIGEAVINNIRIIISNNNNISQKLKEFFLAGEIEEHREVHDSKNRLTDMNEESQLKILETTKVVFQDKDVDLADIIDDKSKKYVKGDVLHKILSRKTIAVAKLNVNRSYDEIKHLYVDRRTKKMKIKQTDIRTETDTCMVTLNNCSKVSDSIVLVTAEPGMGKSTLLTHLSIKTKETNPEVWIVRINLLEYSGQFSEWKNKNTIINIFETLNFMCQVILREKLGKENIVKFTLAEEDNIVYLKDCEADPLIELELNLFLHFYYERGMIFIFDGFDEIYINYAAVVIKCLKTISNEPRKHTMWITSRSYNEIKTMLEQELKLEYSYEIEYFSSTTYLQTFWEYYLNLEELNVAQLENVKKMLEHMSSVYHNQLTNSITYVVIQNAALYLSYKIKNTHIPLWKYKKNYHRAIFQQSPYFCGGLCDCCSCCYCMDTCSKCVNPCRFPNIPLQSELNPLILYLAAVDLEHKIKNNNVIEEYYVDVGHYKIYEFYLANKIKIRYQEKNGNNIYYDDTITAYEEELAKSIKMHKKMAFYAIFYENNQTLFSEKDLEEIKEIIKKVKNGKEKTGIIVGVANEIPIFIHKTFAEHFAAEYICDCLKTENVREEIISFYFDMMFSWSDHLETVQKICNKKMEDDKTLEKALENNKGAIFKWIKRTWEFPIISGVFRWRQSMTAGYSNVESLFNKTIEYVLEYTDLTHSERVMLDKLCFERSIDMLSPETISFINSTIKPVDKPF